MLVALMPGSYILVGIYLVGALIGLVMTDARGPARVAIALLWPLGPAAFVITVTGLLLASLIAYPVIGLTVVALAAALALLLR